jgi:hypothetical protein
MTSAASIDRTSDGDAIRALERADGAAACGASAMFAHTRSCGSLLPKKTSPHAVHGSRPGAFVIRTTVPHVRYDKRSGRGAGGETTVRAQRVRSRAHAGRRCALLSARTHSTKQTPEKER